MAEKTAFDTFWGKFTAPLSTLDTVGLALGVFGGVTAQAAKIGLEVKAANEAATQVDNIYAVNGAIPSVTYGASKEGATGFFRDTAAAAGSYSMGELAGLGTGVILGASTAPAWLVGGVVIVASVGASVVTGRFVTALVDTINPDPQAQAQSSGQPVTTIISDGSIVKTNPDGSWSLSTSTAFYSYDKDGNPLTVVDKATGNIISYDSSTGTASALSASTGLSISVQLSADANGQVTAVDPSTGGSLGSWSVNSLGDLQVSLGGTQLNLPANGGLSAASVTNFNADGSSNTTTFGSDGSATTVLIDAAGDGVGTVIDTPSSVVSGLSTTVFRDGQGNLIGYDTLSAANNGTDSATTLINQYGQDGLFLGTTSSEINADGSSAVSTKNAIGNLIVSDVTAPDGSTVQTTYNSLSDSKLTSTVSTDANGNVSETSTTVAGDTPGSYVSTTLDASGALIEKETQTTDASGTTDYQAYYGGGALTSTSYIATDGSRTDTQYEDPSDPKIIQSSRFDDNGDLISQSSTQKDESDGSYLTITTNPSGQTISTLVETAGGSTTQTVFNDPNDANLKTVIEDDAQGDLVGVSTTTVGTDSDYLTVRQNGNGETTGTDKTTITYDDQGQKTEHIQSYDGNGVPTGSNDEVTSPDGHVNANINGTGVGADLSNATVTLAPDAQANVTGTGNTFAIDSGASLVSQAPDGTSGSQQGNQFTLSSGAILIDYEGNSTVADIITQTFGSTGTNVTLDGGVATTELSGATITTKDGTTLTVVGDNNCVDGNCTVAIDGDGNQFTLHAGDIASINGNDNTANAIGDGAQLSVAGANNSVDATDGIITLDDGTSTTLTGDDNQLSVGSDVAATIVGTDNTGTLNGSGSTITAGDDFTLSMAGASNNDTISIGANGTVNIAGGDQGEVINLMNGILNLGSNVGVTSDGVGGNTISAGADDSLVASNDTISFSGGSDSVSGAGDAIAASDDTLNISNYNGTSDVITGDNNTVNSSWSDVTLDGANESLTGTYDVLALDGLGEIVSGDNNSISFGAGTTASVTSYGDSINLGAGSSLTSNGGGNNTIFATSDDALVLGSTWGTASPYMDTLHVSDDQNITLGSGSAFNLIGSGNALNAGEGDLLIASNDAISFAGSSGSVSGSGDMILASNATLSISNYNAPSDVVTGDNNAVNASWSDVTLNGANGSVIGTYDVLQLAGSGDSVVGDWSSISFDTAAGAVESVAGGSNTINFGAGTTASVTGSNDTINLGTGSSLTSSGGGGDTIYATSDDALALNGAAGNMETLHVSDDQNITLGGNSAFNVIGSDNTLNAGAGDLLVASNDAISFAGSSGSVSGSGDMISASNTTLSISNYNAPSDVITGDSNAVNASWSDVTLNGANGSVIGTYDVLQLAGSGDSVVGDWSSISFDTAAGAVESISGSSNTINLDAGTTVSVTGSNDTINLGTGSSLTSSGGGGDTIYATSDDALALDGAAGNMETLHVSDDQNITLGGNSAFNVIGSDNTLNAEAGDLLVASNDAISFAGSGGSVSGSGDMITASNQTIGISNYDAPSDVITGDNNTVNSSWSDVTLSGTNESVTGTYDVLALAGSGESVAGDWNSISFGAGTTALVTGSSDTINLGAGSSLTSNGGGGNTIYATSDDVLSLGSTAGTTSPYMDTLHVSDDQNITLGSNSTFNLIGSGNTLNAGAGDSLIASNDSISFSGNSGLVSGSGDMISASNATLSISNYNAPSDVITGDNNTVNASWTDVTLNGANGSVVGTYDVLALSGSGESVSGDYNAISLAASTKVSVSGTQDVVTGSSGAITLTGDNSSLVVHGDKDNFSATGTNDRIIDDRADGTSVIYNWSGSGVEADTVYSGAGGSGDIIGGYGYTGAGDGEDLPGSYGGGDDGGGYGFAGTQSLVSARGGANIGSIAQYDLSHGNFSSAESAEAAQQQAASTAALTPTVGSGSAVLEGAKWDQQVITWSLADGAGTQAAPFSGYMGSSKESVVQTAFGAWANAMPGVTFEEVSDSSQSDIRIGFGDFDTANTGVVGYTSYQADEGQMESDVVVRVEDPTQDELTTGTDGQQTYAGTEATLSQVLLHEIGHALGLGDNADQNSVMNYQLTASNRTLDSTDLVGIGSLYGSGSSTASVGSSGVSQLIQAMSTFNADTGVADTTLLPPALLNNNVTLSASAHAA